jgi:hypothetical protein
MGYETCNVLYDDDIGDSVMLDVGAVALAGVKTVAKATLEALFTTRKVDYTQHRSE